MELTLRAIQRLPDVQLGVEEQPVGALELGLHVLGEAASVESHGVQTEERRGDPGGLHIGRHVFLNARPAPHERVRSDAHELVNRRHPSDDGLLVYRDVSGEVDRVAQYHAVSDPAIVRHVDVRHQEAALPDLRPAEGPGPAADGHVLADYGPVPNDAHRRLALVLQILRLAADNRAVVDLAALSDRRPALEYAIREEPAALDDRAGVDVDGYLPHLTCPPRKP